MKAIILSFPFKYSLVSNPMNLTFGHWTAQCPISLKSPTLLGTSIGLQSISPLSTISLQLGANLFLATVAPIKGNPVPTITICPSFISLAMVIACISLFV